MASKSVTFRQPDHLVSVLFRDFLSHFYNITFSIFFHLVMHGVGTFSPVQDIQELSLHLWLVILNMCLRIGVN